ncbi:MAG TPA: hypothetical protein VJ836_06480 [Candidatus Saccharimonadales bacterium]|nr:hypothetical protein [Candidatus Saccharimonadales bacterium]
MKISKHAVSAGIIGIIIGGIIVLGIRFFTYHPDMPHYHANFALYINGERETFEGPGYYEEVSGSCAAGKDITPPQRVHMHDNVSDVVHVHDYAATWGHFFQNLRWSVGRDYIKTPTEMYVADEENKVAFLLNGRPMDDISNETIQSGDRLLIDFGTTSEVTLQKRMKAIANNAQEHNHAADPAACMGAHQVTWKDRLKHLF